MSWQKYMPWFKIIKLFMFGLKFLTKYFEDIRHHHTCFVYQIYTWYINLYTHYIHSSSFEPKIWWRCTIVFTTRPFQDFDEIKRKFSFIMFDIKLFKNSNFNICFFFQNLFKCYKWKHDLEAYSRIYSWK